MLNEQEIINGCKKFRHSAQKALYERYAPLMFGVCLRYVYDKNEVKDVLQEGFIKVFDKIGDFKEQGSIRNWITRIMINHTINHNRKNRKYQNQIDIECISDNDDHLEADLTEGIDKSSYSPLKFEVNEADIEVIGNMDFSYNELLEVLNSIPESFKVVFNLHCIEQIKHEEIAKMLKIDIATSRTRLLRARKIIKKELVQRSIIKIKQSSQVADI